MMGALLTIVITLTAGTAMFGYVYSQLGVSESQLGGAIGGNINQLRESFVIPYASFPVGSRGNITLGIYNNGRAALNLTTVRVSGNISSVSAWQIGSVTFTHANVVVASNSGSQLCSTSTNVQAYEFQNGSPLTLGSVLYPLGNFTNLRLSIPDLCGFDFGLGSFSILAIGSNGYTLVRPIQNNGTG
ncbi:MAG: hypothetical protein HY296_00385 [Thaumarchaeota archaeon]|nr:hypothetical protein [Nitrososphaerota archaeon]